MVHKTSLNTVECTGCVADVTDDKAALQLLQNVALACVVTLYGRHDSCKLCSITVIKHLRFSTYKLMSLVLYCTTA